MPARRQCARSDLLNRRLPWRAWCALGAADALTVAWVLGTRAGRPLRFVQIGSNDGVLHDPIHQVVRACGWSGVLVEPLPDLFAKLVANYEGVPHLSFENAAVGAEDGTTTMFTVDPRPGDPYWVSMIASFDPEAILVHRDVLPDVANRMVEVSVETLTLGTLVKRHDLQTIDLLHVDAEGHDHAILGQIDFGASWAPPFIIFEKEHFDSPTFRRTRRMLRTAGYRCVDVWPDEFAYRIEPGAGAAADSSPSTARP